MPNIDFSCDTPDCIFWKDGECIKPGAVTIQEHHCVDFEEATRSPMNFTTDARIKEIVDNALDYLGELCRGSELYDLLHQSIGLTDEEILAAGFTTLKDYMDEEDE